MVTRRLLPQSLPVARPGAPLCIVPSLPVRLGTVSPHRSTDVFVLDVEKFTVRAIQVLALALNFVQVVACFKAHNNGIAALQLSHDGRFANIPASLLCRFAL